MILRHELPDPHRLDELLDDLYLDVNRDIRWEHPDWHPSPGERAAADQAEAAALSALRSTRSDSPQVGGDRRDLRPAVGELDPHSEGVNPLGVIGDRRGDLDGTCPVDPLHTDGPDGGAGKWSPGSGAEA
jgi:hypothetical protein